MVFDKAQRAYDRVRNAYHHVRRRLRLLRAERRRPGLEHIRFIAVTGSGGKTTATALIGQILSSVGPCHVAVERNTLYAAAATLRKVSRRAHYCVQEVGANTEGPIAEIGALLRPHVAVVTVVGRDHHQLLRTLEGTAREKGALVASLPDDGIAILNADDSHVRAMAELRPVRVVSFGRAETAHVRASDVSSTWPQRLSFTVTWREETVRVQTRLVGEHWLTPVLASIACCVSQGIDLQTCARVVNRFEPVFNRFSVHEWRGASFVLDAQKAPVWSIEICLKPIAAARARRKTVVIGTLSDTPGAATPKYLKAAKRALASANRVVFAGPQASRVRSLAGDFSGRLFMVRDAYEAYRLLAADLVPGELIYVKGSISDHLERLVLAHIDSVVCWKNRCGRTLDCLQCPHYRTPSPPGQTQRDEPVPVVPTETITTAPAALHRQAPTRDTQAGQQNVARG